MARTSLLAFHWMAIRLRLLSPSQPEWHVNSLLSFECDSLIKALLLRAHMICQLYPDIQDATFFKGHFP